MSYTNNYEQLINIYTYSDYDYEEENDKIQIFKNSKNRINNLLVRKKQLFDKLDSSKLTYIKGGICDAYIKYGYPSLDQVVNDIQNTTDEEYTRLEKILKQLNKQQLIYDKNIIIS